MCRYAWHNYRDHFACFDCRKAFKYWQWAETDEATFYRKQQLQHVPLCDGWREARRGPCCWG